MERMSSWGSSVTRRTLSPSSRVTHQLDNDAESDSASEAGDIGDRALHSSGGKSNHLSFDHMLENGAVSIPGNQKLQPSPGASNSISYAKTSGKVGSEDVKQEADIKLPKILDYVSCLVHLSVFGILGVLTRYMLEKLFGPDIGDVTSDQTLLYPDLPSNMVGSFLMGWFGVVFKGDISRVSDNLAIGLTSGYLGSLTTFSGWNQKMLDLIVAGHWLFAVLGFLIGFFLVAYSIIFGVETAKGFRWLLSRLSMSSGGGTFISKVNRKVHSFKCQLSVVVVFLLMLCILWVVSGALVKAEFKHGGPAAQLWIACLIGPLGVWIRWYLARLNGRGIGTAGLLKWIPFGTLIANVSAACIMAALATAKKTVDTKNCDTMISGIQFGLLGCLSTVSTFAAEFNAMRESMHPWRAYAYAMITICVSLVCGIIIYCLPVWRT